MKDTEKKSFGPSMPIFPFVLHGTIEKTDVLIPFISYGDLDSYVESLQFIAKRELVTIDLCIYQQGTLIGKINIVPTVH